MEAPNDQHRPEDAIEELRQARSAVDARLLAALESGEATEMSPADWAEIRRAGPNTGSGRATDAGSEPDGHQETKAPT